MTRAWIISGVALLALTALGALAGHLSAPALARMNYFVKLSEHVLDEQTRGPGEIEDEYVAAFRATGLPAEQIHVQAREIQQRFARGALWFGLWCGLVAGWRVSASIFIRRRRIYETDPANCVSCGRCYLACPVERKRIRGMGETA